MARKTKETVSVDEVREEMTNAPLEGKAETPAEETAPEVAEGETPEGVTPADETPEAEGGEIVESTLHLRVEVCDPQDSIKEVKDAMSLRVRLSDEALVEYSDEMIEAMDDAKRARSRLKGYQAECKQEEEEALQRAEEAKAKLRSKHEERRVECIQIHNFTRGKVYTIRLDTGELVQERGMQPWERQADIEDVTSGQAEPEAEEATEAQADFDDTDEIEIDDEDGDQEEGGELAGVATGDDEEGEI